MGLVVIQVFVLVCVCRGTWVVHEASVLGLSLVYGWQLIVNVAAEGRLFRRP